MKRAVGSELRRPLLLAIKDQGRVSKLRNFQIDRESGAGQRILTRNPQLNPRGPCLSSGMCDPEFPYCKSYRRLKGELLSKLTGNKGTDVNGDETAQRSDAKLTVDRAASSSGLGAINTVGACLNRDANWARVE